MRIHLGEAIQHAPGGGLAMRGLFVKLRGRAAQAQPWVASLILDEPMNKLSNLVAQERVGEFMKRAIILTITFLIAATIVTAQSKNKNIEQEFMGLHRAEDEAESKKDLVALDRLLNEDFIFVAGNGSISDKKKCS
jgi:hypothetical protein